MLTKGEKIMSILKRKLTESEQAELLDELFMFRIDDGVIYDDDGYEFYGFDSNNKYDLSSLKGIFELATDKAREDGKFEKALEIKKALWIR